MFLKYTNDLSSDRIIATRLQTLRMSSLHFCLVFNVAYIKDTTCIIKNVKFNCGTNHSYNRYELLVIKNGKVVNPPRYIFCSKFDTKKIIRKLKRHCKKVYFINIKTYYEE